MEVISTWKTVFLPKKFASGIFNGLLFSIETHQNSQQNIALFAKQTQSQIKTDKRAKIPCFRARDIAITSYQTLVMLHIIDSCQTSGFLKCLVFFIFCLAIFLKELHKNVKAPKWELRESILHLMFSYLLPFILAATCYAKS